MNFQIKVKFDIGDKVFLLEDNKIVTGIIDKIYCTRCKISNKFFNYYIIRIKTTNTRFNSYSIKEDLLFSTKEELIASL